jgi:hypothetical protein
VKCFAYFVEKWKVGNLLKKISVYFLVKNSHYAIVHQDDKKSSGWTLSLFPSVEAIPVIN